MPRFSVFQRPPKALATYQTLGFFGSISTSWMRPVVSVGPMLRNSMPLRASAVTPVASGPCPVTTPVTQAASVAINSVCLVMR